MNDYVNQCLVYIIEHESEDYYEWCKDNGYNPERTWDKENLQHIYAVAMEAFPGHEPKDFLISVTRIEKISELDDEDRQGLSNITGDRLIVARNKEQALDFFHQRVPISCPADFEIECEEVKYD